MKEKHYRLENSKGIWEIHEIIYSPFRPPYISFTYLRKTKNKGKSTNDSPFKPPPNSFTYYYEDEKKRAKKEEIRKLLQKYKAKPIPMNKNQLAKIKPLSEKMAIEEVKRYTKAMQMSWIAAYRKIIG